MLVTCSNIIVVIASMFDQVFLILSKIPLGNSFAPEANPLGIPRNSKFFEITYEWHPLWLRNDFHVSQYEELALFLVMPFSCMTLQLTFVKSVYRSSRWISMNARARDASETTSLHCEIIRITSFCLTQNAPAQLALG